LKKLNRRAAIVALASLKNNNKYIFHHETNNQTPRHNTIHTPSPTHKAEIIERFKMWYPWGCASKYIPVQLAALVKHGYLECKDGIYTLLAKTEKQTK